MSERKSGRSRKVVDYTKFGGNDDFDDDFADSTPPASKKPRLSNKENKDRKSSKIVQKVEIEVKQKSASNRKSLEERRFERELQEVLQLSLSQSDPSQETAGFPADTNQNEAPPIIIEDDEQSVPSPILPAVDNPPVLKKVSKDEDDIEVLETSIEEVPSSRRGAKKAKKYIDSDSEESGGEDYPPVLNKVTKDEDKKAKKYIDSDSEESGGGDFEIDLRKFLSSPLTPKIKKKKDEDSDFAPDDDNDDDDDSFDENNDDEEEDDYNPEDSDSDFGSSKKKKSAKKTTTKSNAPKGSTKNAKVAKTPAVSVKLSTGKSVKTTKPPAAGKTVITHKPLAASSPSSRTPGSGLTAHKPPNWKAPGQASEGKSPTVLNSKTNNVIGKSPIGPNTKSKPSLSAGVGKSPLGGVNIKSPSSGLRLGLSRNMKLKPLHPNLKTHN